MKKKIGKIITGIFIFLGFLLFFAARWVMNTFGSVTMEEIVFNLKVPMAGVNTDYIWGFVKRCLVPTFAFCAIAAVCIFVYRIIINKYLKKRKIFKVANIMPAISSVLVIVLGTGYGLKKLDIPEYIHNEFDTSTFIEENYINPNDVQLSFPEEKRNLIYIVLESMEYTFGLTENGGAYDIDMISELNTIANENVNFSNNELVGGLVPTAGSTWTVGALFTQTSGVPLKLAISGNSMDQYSSFMPGITNLGDILKENGYNNYFMLGSDSDYAGRTNYFTQHGDYEIFDYKAAKATGKIPSDYYEWWGYEDNKLFEYAKEKLLEVAQDDEPFNFTMLTADTHFEDGYVSEGCTDEFGDNQYANVIAYSSKQVNEFVEWIKEQDFYENTTIVIIGDHNTMDVDFAENVPSTYQRGVYNAFINVPFEAENTKNRYTTTFDMFPTTLASIGVEIEGNRLGLGTNLFSGEETVLESFGGDLSALNDHLNKKSKFYNSTFLYAEEK